MNHTMQQITPVVISILAIVFIAVVQAHSKLIAAITATMPLGIPLALWIVFAAEGNSNSDVLKFTESLFFGMLATGVFTLVLWITARAGWGLLPMLGASYLAWLATLGLNLLVRAAR